MRLWGIAASVLSLIYSFVLVWPTAVLALFARGHAASVLIRLWARLVLWTCGVKAEVRGLENLDGVGSCVFVSNHQSLVDIMVMFRYLPREIRFVAKHELRKLPLIGWAMVRLENVVIDRQAGGKAIRRALEVPSHGYSICVFAEGRRHSDNCIHEFNDGAAWLAIKTGLPCVPMAMSGTASILPRGAGLARPARRIRVVLGRPIPTRELKPADRASLTKRLEREVRALFAAGPV